jgi:hypothetical protein
VWSSEVGETEAVSFRHKSLLQCAGRYSTHNNLLLSLNHPPSLSTLSSSKSQCDGVPTGHQHPASSQTETALSRCRRLLFFGASGEWRACWPYTNVSLLTCYSLSYVCTTSSTRSVFFMPDIWHWIRSMELVRNLGWKVERAEFCRILPFCVWDVL